MARVADASASGPVECEKMNDCSISLLSSAAMATLNVYCREHAHLACLN